MSNSLLKAFNVKIENKYNEAVDYDIFKDKELLEKFRKKILEDLSNRGMLLKNVSNDVLNEEIDEIINGYDLSSLERNYLYNLIDNEVNGYGPLTELLKDKNVTEIMVNSPSDIYIETDGNIVKDNSVSFIDNAHIVRTIEKLLAASGRMIDINNPMIDARGEDGSRINAIIPPLSKNPIITIRKFRPNLVDMETLVGNGSLTPYMARFLQAAVQARLNILISGGAGTGKTTLLNILSNYIDTNERIITIEDALELNLKQSNVVSLETKTANYEGVGEVTIRDLVRNSLRMRPDRIIIGEVRGNEAIDLLQAMNTGHDGSITTLHANSPLDALRRLETMVLMDNKDVSLTAVREYMSNAIDLVVHMSRMRDGKRKIVAISEVVGTNNGEIVMKDIFDFKVQNVLENGTVEGEYTLYKYVPKCLEKMQNAGIRDLDEMFKFKKGK